MYISVHPPTHRHELDAHAERDDELVAGDGGEERPHARRRLLQPHGEALEYGVQAERQDGEELSEVGGGAAARADSVPVQVAVAVSCGRRKRSIG